MADKKLAIEKDEKGRFQTGNSGGGRPKGSRNKLSELFFNDLYGKWQEKGAQAIDEMIAARPGDFVKCVASVMPKEFSLDGNVFGGLSESEIGDFLAALRAVKAGRVGTPAGNGAEETTRH
jgi:hypothetical protein